MMLIRWGIPALPSLSPVSTPYIHLSRISCRPGLSRPFSSLICRCSRKTDDNAEKYRRPTEDTRIHWGSSEEGWIGGMSEPPEVEVSSNEEMLSTWRTDRNGPLMGLLVLASDSHYRYLELTPDAETEEIKAAYRRLSKTYHPDTTSLPLQVAAEKFVRLKEAYTVLSSEEDRRFYDWQLAQKIFKQKQERAIWAAEAAKTMADDGSTLFEVGKRTDNIVPDPVDRLGGRNMELSGQAQVAIVFDVFAVVVSVSCIIYTLFFKDR